MRRKKTNEDVTEPVAPVPAMKVVERREYTTAMPHTEQVSQPQTVTIPAREVEEESDELTDFLTELEDEIGLSLRVDRLPQYSTNGKWQKGAAFEFCDNMPVNKSDLKNGQYMAMIRDLFGPATYRCTLREVGAGIVKVWVIKIAAPMQQAAQPRQIGSSIVYQQPGTVEPQPVRDTLQELLDAGEKAQKLRQVFGWDHEPQAPIAPVATVVEPLPIQDRIIEAALNAALKTEKPETIAGLLQSYLNPNRDEFSWKEIIGEVLKPMVPVLTGLLGAYMQNQARQQAMQQPHNVTQVPQQQGALPPSQQGGFANVPIYADLNAQYMQQAQQPIPSVEIPQNQPNVTVQPEPLQEQPMSIEDEEEDSRDNLIFTLADMLEDCVRQAMSDPTAIAKGRDEVLAYKQRFPFMSTFLDALYAMPPEIVIGLLSAKVPEIAAMINNETAKQVIRDFQASLRQPTEEQTQ